LGDVDTLKKAADNMGIQLSDEKLKLFSVYKSLLVEWNQKFNLTNITESDEIDIKHFADSLSPALSGELNGNLKLIDIGTGAGFPGIPLKIWNDSLDVTLVDSLNKRVNFLKEVISQLGLEGIEAVHGRAEEMGLSVPHRQVYDICISRAVASLNTLSEYCMPFVKSGGWFIAMKGPAAEEEVQEASKAIEILGGKIDRIEQFTLPGTDINYSIVMIRKVKSTPSKYPRGGGKPRKSPL
jgi:16S rRNA (guanine527-N7)-methyltransferase